MSYDVNKNGNKQPQNLEEMMLMITKSANGARFQIKVSANSKKNSIDFEADFIKLKISKPAVDGKANKEIINYLSDILNLPKNNIKILNGEKSSLKMLLFMPKTLQ